MQKKKPHIPEEKGKEANFQKFILNHHITGGGGCQVSEA